LLSRIPPSFICEEVLPLEHSLRSRFLSDSCMLRPAGGTVTLLSFPECFFLSASLGGGGFVKATCVFPPAGILSERQYFSYTLRRAPTPSFSFKQPPHFLSLSLSVRGAFRLPQTWKFGGFYPTNFFPSLETNIDAAFPLSLFREQFCGGYADGRILSLIVFNKVAIFYVLWDGSSAVFRSCGQPDPPSFEQPSPSSP